MVWEYSIGGGDMITSDTKIYSKSEGMLLDGWEQLADLMIKVGIIKDIFEVDIESDDDLGRHDYSWMEKVEWWREEQMRMNPKVEKLNRGQFYIGVKYDYDAHRGNDSWGIFYVNPLSREEWESNSDVGLIYLGVEPVALICEDETKNKGKDMTERTPILNVTLPQKGVGYNSTLADVTILNEPSYGGYNPWSMGYDQSWFESGGWEFHPVSLEVETQRQLGVFNWWW